MYGPILRFLVCVIILELLGACGNQEHQYFPLAAGRWWQYRVAVSNSITQWEYKFLSENLPPVEIRGERLNVRRVHNGQLHFFRNDAFGLWHVGSRSAGDGEILGGPAKLSFPAVPAPNTTWEAPDETQVLRTRAANDNFRDYLIHLPIAVHYRVLGLADSVETRTGQFSDCIRIEGTGTAQFDLGIDVGAVRVKVTIIDWYAPGVGLVKRERQERTDSPFINDGNYALELERWGR